MVVTATNSEGYAAPAGITVDVVILAPHPELGLSVLLVKRTEAPYKGRWALPGGFVGYDPKDPEDDRATAARKLEEKTGVRSPHLQLLSTAFQPGRDPRGWIPAVRWMACIPEPVVADGGTQTARWHAVDAVGKLAFDHSAVVAEAVERARGHLMAGLLPETFTLKEAHRVYELVTDESINYPNFRRDLQKSGLVEPTGETKPTQGPPAKLFRWTARADAPFSL